MAGLERLRKIAESMAAARAKGGWTDLVRRVVLMGAAALTFTGLFLMRSKPNALPPRTRLTPATAPAARVAPSITAASSSCVASAVNTAPWPALNSGQSSSACTATHTASSAEPPRASTAWPAHSTSCSAAW